MIGWSAHLSMLFTERAPLDRPAAAGDAGFRRVESWWPPAEDPLEWARTVREAGLRASAVNAEAGDIAAGERGFCNLHERAEDVLASVREAVVVARAAGADGVNLLVGRAAPDRSWERQLAQAREVVRESAVLAGGKGVRILLEPINAQDVPDSLLPTPDAMAAFARSVGHDGVRLLYDAYHAARAGLDPCEDVARHADLIGHVQYADCPGRGAPGTGRVDLWRLVERLDALGYAGAIGLEYDPRGDTAATLGALAAAPAAAPFPET